MSVITSMRRQKAVYWKQGPLGVTGQPTFLAPVEIDCRWEDESVEFLNNNAERLASKAVVYVDRDMQEKDVLMLSTLNSAVLDDPFDNANAFSVRGFASLPNFKATEFLRTAYL